MAEPAVATARELSRSMTEGGDYTPEQVEEYDYWTKLLPDEY